MKKKDLVETAILLLGLWSLYNALTSLFYVVYYFLGETFSYSPVYDPTFFSIYSSETISFGILAFLCFFKRTLLLKNLNFHVADRKEQQNEKEDNKSLFDPGGELRNIASKIDLMEIGIVVLCLGVFFTVLSQFLYAVLNFFKSKLAGDNKHGYNLTLPFFKLLIPLVAVAMRDKVIQLLYYYKAPVS
jgi:hypothetical protein